MGKRENSSPIKPAPPGLPRNWWAVAAWIAVFVVLTGLLQWFIPYPIDDDTAYHFSVGQLIKMHGILHEFPWTPFSWQFDHYADKEFLFHLFFFPLGGLGFVTAARLVGTLAGALVLTVLYLILRAEKVQFAGVWALLPLGCSEFLFRLGLVRPHLLSITFALVVMWAFARERLYLLAAVAFLYPLTYVAYWQIPLILTLAAESAPLLAGERVRWKPVAVLAGGISLGLALHPNTYNLIQMNWIHMSDILFQSAWSRKALNLGKEFNPFPLVDWGRYLVIVVLMAGAASVMSWRNRKSCSVSLAFALAAVFFGLLTARSLRFIEYFVPFSVAAAALAVRSMKKPFLAPAILALSLLYTAVLGTESYKNLSMKHKAHIEPEIARLFSQKIPVGSQVFTTGWDYTGNLMLALPERYFIVAADPTLFLKKDPALYDIWCRIPLDAPIDSVEAIRRLFKSRFVISLNFQAYWPFFDTLSADPTVKTLFTNEKWVLFDLGESGSGPRLSPSHKAGKKGNNGMLE
jgi:hypothetical protein